MADQTAKRMTFGGWPPERWAAVIVLSALALLILINMGFRSVNVLGVKVSAN